MTIFWALKSFVSLTITITAFREAIKNKKDRDFTVFKFYLVATLFMLLISSMDLIIVFELLKHL